MPDPSIRIKPVASLARSVSALFLLALLPYLFHFNHAFVYDDHGQIVENRFLAQKDSWKAVALLRTMHDPLVINGRRPLTLATGLLDHALWGFNPVGWRLSNWMMHLANVLLLYGWVRRVMQRQMPFRRNNLFAFSAALLFAWHPVLIEAVHVPAFRPDLLYSLFVLLTAHALLGRGHEWKRVCIALITAFCALLSKETGIIAGFFVVLMWMLFPKTRPSLQLMSVFSVGALLGVLWFFSSGSASDHSGAWQALGQAWNGRSLQWPENIWTLPRIAWTALRILAIPYPLVVDRVVTPVTSPWSWSFIGGATMLLLLLASAWGCRKRVPWVTMGLAMMALGFLPVSNLVPLMNPLAERYLYFIAMGWACGWAWVLTGVGLTPVRRAVLGALCVLYLIAGQVRLPQWQNDATLWAQTVRDEPRSARAYTWVGLERMRQEQWVEAVEYFDRAQALNPYDDTSAINRAIVYGRLGEVEVAERMLREALALRPDHAAAYWNLAMALQAQHRLAEAAEALGEVIRLDPLHIEARKARIILWIALESYEEALAEAESLQALTPDDPEAAAALDYLRPRVDAKKNP